MKKFLFMCFFSCIWVLSGNTQQVSSYSIAVHFFPSDAQMWGYPVSNTSFMRGNAEVEFSEIDSDMMTFYLHGELKIDSIKSGNHKIDYSSEKILYHPDYSMVGLKTTITATNEIRSKKIHIHYSGFMNPSRAQSLSNYMHINRHSGVFLRAYGYSVWFPVFLETGQEFYKANFKDVSVTLPVSFKCVVTGELIKESIENDHYHAIWQPGVASIFDVQCTAREYQRTTQNNVSVYSVGDQKIAERIIDFTQQLKNLYLSNLRRVHDTSSLFIIEMPEYGNISNQNIIGISSDVYNEFEKSSFSKQTIAHELVHPYVWIPISHDHPFYALVVEGFPGFFHYYGLKKLDESFNLEEIMKRKEESYIQKKESGKDRRGNALPEEKTILEISDDEIGVYKDYFILPDRVPLFLYHFWVRMGDADFDLFLKELFVLNTINYQNFEKLVIKYLPGYKDDLNIWLNTTDYPDSIQIKSK